MDPAQQTAPMTPAFLAPEHQHTWFQDQKLDTFLLGLLFVELRFGHLPFCFNGSPPTVQPAQYCQELENPSCPYLYDDPATGRVGLTAQELVFVKSCLAPNLGERPTVAWMLQNSPYLQEVQ